MEPFRIVVVLDRSELSDLVLEHALDHARRHEAPELHFVMIVEDPHASLPAIKERLTALVLDDIDLFQRLHPDWSGHLHVRYGWADREVPAFARAVRADLVVLAASDDVGAIASATPCPLLVLSLDEPDFETGSCPKCAKVRAESNGERLFCDDHASDHVSLRIESSSLGGGTLMW